MKTKILLPILGTLLLLSFIKSFFYPSNSYDVVFITVLTALYTIQQYFCIQKDKDNTVKLTEALNLRLNAQDEQIENIRNNTSRLALSAGMRR